MCVLSLSWNFFVSHDKYSARPSSKEPRWYTGTTGDTFRIVIHLSSTEYDNFSLSLVPVSTKVLQWYQTPQSTPTATPPSSARRLLGDYRGVEWNRCLRRSGEFLRYWITGKPLSWQFSIINPQLWRISLLYVRAESIIKLRQWSCLNPWMLSTKLAFDHCIAKHHSVRCVVINWLRSASVDASRQHAHQQLTLWWSLASALFLALPGLSPRSSHSASTPANACD